jgi:hypothetical protein
MHIGSPVEGPALIRSRLAEGDAELVRVTSPIPSCSALIKTMGADDIWVLSD